MFTMAADGRPLAEGMETFLRDATRGAGWVLCERGAALARFHARTWQEELRAFAWLDPEQRVSRSEFAGGSAVLVNRGDEALQVEGTTVPARDYVELDGTGARAAPAQSERRGGCSA